VNPKRKRQLSRSACDILPLFLPRITAAVREHQPRTQRRLLLHRRDGVRVGVERDRDGGVPEAFRDDPGMDVGLEV
jgi:hypothetical protein